MIYDQEARICHSKTNLVRKFTGLYNVPFFESSLCCIGFSLYLCPFKYEFPFILPHIALCKEACNCHSKTNLIRRFTVIHNIPFLEIHLVFQGLLSIYYHFHFETTLIRLIMLYGKNSRSSHSKTNLFRRFNSLNLFPLWELSLCFLGSLLIYHCFHLHPHCFWLIMC
jgi:hypothetical protein